MMLTFCIVAVGLFLLLQVLNLIIVFKNIIDNPQQISGEQLPNAAVLVAARNEENNITACLNSLLAQNYPAHKFTILVGNDQSTDKTELLIDEIAERHHQVKKINIIRNLGLAKGKANVLATLAKHTQADLLLITDADIVVNSEWAKTMVSFFNENVGIVSGKTIVNRSGYLAPMQHIDWLYFMGFLQNFSRLKLTATAVGNNMAISKIAYESTGGYENIPFSVTEDYKLYQAVTKKGWKTLTVNHPNTMNISTAVVNFKTLINQRHRWLTGAKEMPWYWWLIFGVFGLFIPSCLVLLFLYPALAAGIYSIKLLLQSITIYIQQKQLNIRTNILAILVYEPYTVALTFVTAFYFILPIKTTWKSRRF